MVVFSNFRIRQEASHCLEAQLAIYGDVLPREVPQIGFHLATFITALEH